MRLNQQALSLCDALLTRAEALHAEVHGVGGGTLIDLGVKAVGGLDAGLALAEICLAGLGRVSLVPADPAVWRGPAVTVQTDHPVAACLASQYAGWQIAQGKFFAMGSGPMRAAAGSEALFERIGFRERPPMAVGVLETGKLPPGEVVADLARQCGVEPAKLTMLAARTASQAGTVQIVARSVETALHKLYELGFDLARLESGGGGGPLAPPADAILSGAEVTLWVRGDDASLEAIGPRVPSSASPEHGEPFVRIFERYDRDFYKIDPLLFSPAVVTLANLDTGRSFRFGSLLPEVIERSFKG